MKLSQLRDVAIDNSHFTQLDDFITFCRYYLDFISIPDNIQARIIAQNEPQYHFLQYKKDGGYQITRPINSDLFLSNIQFDSNISIFKDLISNFPAVENSIATRQCVNKTLYTIQQCLGSTLDALPAVNSNKARKINGTLFEKLILIFLNNLRISAKAETLDLPVIHNNKVLFSIKYQHDIVIRNDLGDVKVIGAIKTTSKDRIDKVFIDKLLYSRLSATDIQHIAIILNDVQRQKTKVNNQFNVGSTFLPGRFKGYMIKLCPLDGVYYFDIRKAMQTDKHLKEMISTFDQLIFDELPLLFNNSSQ